MVFNFDYLIIIILVSSILLGFNRGFYRQLKATFALAVPFAVIYFVKEPVLDSLKGIGLFNKVMEAIHSGARFLLNISVEELMFLVVAIIIYIIVSSIVKLILALFSPSAKTSVVKRVSKPSKIIGASMGLVAAYCLIIMALFLIKPVSNIDFSTPITNIVVSTNQPLQDQLNIE